jgi:CubicO group peptidase (beta-lactamase class C family)
VRCYAPVQLLPHPNRKLKSGACLICFFIVTCACAYSAESSSRGLVPAVPEAVGLLSSRLKNIDAAVQKSIEAKDIPGAVVLVGRRGRIAYLKAFGHRSIQPEKEAMTVDTIFDLASLTKVIATTPAIMMLVEDGALRLDDKVKRYLPKFSGGGKDSITVRQLLTHFSGLRPDFELSRQWEGSEAAMEELSKETTQTEPGKEFCYSDLNFLALGEIVRVLSGKDLAVFVQESIFEPLGMSDTGFRPAAELRGRIAPTESRKRTLEYQKGSTPSGVSEELVRGEVHDPTAWRMGGIAGHAGLFSSARDLAVFSQMLLNRGTYQGKRILSALAVQAMTSPQSPKNMVPTRGLGWDIDSPYSSPRGDLLVGGFGHTGFTGTSLWIHPPSETFVLILSNRVYPDGKGDVTHLRGVIANIVAAALPDLR